MSKTRGPIRRNQLIIPSGPGSIVVDRFGVSIIVCGLDKWYKYEDCRDEGRRIDLEEFHVEEWRLQRLLKVDHFRLPPDWRDSKSGRFATGADQIPNQQLTVPFLRFPTWHVCPRCSYLEQVPITQTDTAFCKKCRVREDFKIRLVQVPFVAVCDHGHIQDFPWREWVHRSVRPSCNSNMRLVATGGSSLGSQRIQCDCGTPTRTLTGISDASADGQKTHLSQSLDQNKEIYLCQGVLPWHGSMRASDCQRHLRGSLMSSTNVYYPRLYSSIYLPSEEKGAPDELVALFRTTPLCTMLSLLRQLGQPGEVSLLRQQHRQLLQQWDDNEIKSAINVVDGEDDRRANEFADDGTDRGENFRYQEYRVLSEPRRSHYLAIEGHAISKYQEFLRKYFQRICLVEKLRETRVLAGFSRIIPDFPDDPEYVKNLLWKEKPSPFWLPAAIVFGEGIFLELNLDYLNTWEQKTDVNSRINEIRSSAAKGLSRLRFNGEELTVRFFLLHTLAHALINRLIFECGYSSASLKERLYVSRNPTHPMAGLLIYTAAGDSEGTLGGLVRMGEPGVLEPVIAKALEKAQWCSTDPVCMESVQGPDACNLAACHACALVPETSCENFNRFLDRGMLIGWIESPNSGYFSRSDSLLDSKSAE